MFELPVKLLKRLDAPVAVDSAGNFVVVWHSTPGGGGSDDYFSIQAQRFDANGAPVGGQFQVSSRHMLVEELPEGRQINVLEKRIDYILGSGNRSRAYLHRTPEGALVELAKNDADAFGELYRRHVDRIYTYIYYRTGNATDAEDLTARTFHQALTHLPRYTDHGVPFPTADGQGHAGEDLQPLEVLIDFFQLQDDVCRFRHPPTPRLKVYLSSWRRSPKCPRGRKER